MARKSVRNPPKAAKLSPSSLKMPPAIARHVSCHIDPLTGKGNFLNVEPISVGKVGRTLYLMNDFEFVERCRAMKVPYLDSCVTSYDSISELLADHVTINYQCNTIDPLKIRSVIDAMMRDGKTKKEVYEMLRLKKRPKLSEVVHSKIYGKAMDVMLDLSYTIASNFSPATMPMYYVTRLSDVYRDKQYQVAVQIKLRTYDHGITAEGFRWLDLEKINAIISLPTHSLRYSHEFFRRSYLNAIDDDSIPKNTTFGLKYDTKSNPYFITAILPKYPHHFTFDEETGKCAALPWNLHAVIIPPRDGDGQSKILFPPQMNIFELSPNSHFCMSEFSTLEECEAAMRRVLKRDRDKECILICRVSAIIR